VVTRAFADVRSGAPFVQIRGLVRDAARPDLARAALVVVDGRQTVIGLGAWTYHASGSPGGLRAGSLVRNGFDAYAPDRTEGPLAIVLVAPGGSHPVCTIAGERQGSRN
jgi:hypothetical protein